VLGARDSSNDLGGKRFALFPPRVLTYLLGPREDAMKSALKVLTVAGAFACVLAIGLAFAQDFEANEAAAIGALKTITTSQAIFREGDKEQDGNLDYGMLTELSNVTLVDAVLGSGTKQGYFFRAAYSPTTSEFLWWGTASPQKPGETGENYYFTNQSGVIYSSKEPIRVDPETCQVPAGLEPMKPPVIRDKLCRELGSLAGADGENVHLFDAVEPGEVYVFDSRGGSLVITIESKSDKEVSYSVQAGGRAVEHEVTKLSPSKTRFRTYGTKPPGATKLRDDVFVVSSSIQIPCVVESLPPDVVASGTLWSCPDRFPFVLKLVDKSGSVTLELKEIQNAKPNLEAKCRKCGASFESEDRYCAKCGAARPGIAVCPNCGARFREGAKFCTRCGRPRPE
jgi:hypothetical protein